MATDCQECQECQEKEALRRNGPQTSSATVYTREPTSPDTAAQFARTAAETRCLVLPPATTTSMAPPVTQEVSARHKPTQ